jgi:hypothetical protein
VFPCDDQPFLFDAGGKTMVGIPHSIELADYNTVTRTGQAFAQWDEAIREQVDVLAEEATRTGTGYVAIVNVHPHVMGQPFRVRHFAQLIADLKRRSDLWWATQSQVATYYRQLPFNA